MGRISYSRAMGELPAYIVLNLETKEPIELGDFVGTFVALGSDYERFIAERGLEDKSEAKIYVKEGQGRQHRSRPCSLAFHVCALHQRNGQGSYRRRICSAMGD